MTNEQRKYLKQRFAEAERLLKSRALDKAEHKDTPQVKAARRVIEQHNSLYRLVYKRIMNRVDREIAKHKEVLLFHDSDKALAAVKKFEKLVHGGGRGLWI